MKSRVLPRSDWQMNLFAPWDEQSLAALCCQLGARQVTGWSHDEEVLVNQGGGVEAHVVEEIRAEITCGNDPLGEIFSSIRTPLARRGLGATYTPSIIVNAMMSWAKTAQPKLVVDPGVGSARFLSSAAKTFPHARLFGCDIDPLATLMARATLATLGLEDRSEIQLGDYRRIVLPTGGPKLFVGNPPYVRHHQIEAKWKEWLTTESRRAGCRGTQLAGLHVHFFLATSLKAAKGDLGCFITSAEWLDVNYGSLVRDLFLKVLGGTAITVLEPTVEAFLGRCHHGRYQLFPRWFAAQQDRLGQGGFDCATRKARLGSPSWTRAS